jgi:hypothetical protein
MYVVLGAGLVMQRHRPTKWLPAATHFNPHPPLFAFCCQIKINFYSSFVCIMTIESQHNIQYSGFL